MAVMNPIKTALLELISARALALAAGLRSGYTTAPMALMLAPMRTPNASMSGPQRPAREVEDGTK